MEKFAQVSENQVTAAIVREFSQEFLANLASEVVIIGAGPSGLVAGRELAKDGLKVLIIESNNYLGGGFWVGGYLMNVVTFRSPAQDILEELSIPYRQVEPGLFTASGPHACSKLIASACDSGVKFLNLTKFDDVILKGNRIGGVVVNWAPVSILPKQITCVDPVAIEAKLIIDATGHDAAVAAALERRGLIKTKGFGPMDVGASEDLVVEYTKEIYPGLIACGMSVATVFGLPRMGPTFAGMLVSGKRAATLAKELLAKEALAI
ncbi:MAG: ribose 1,5-bisphosphate isomerase [Omnitrophica WOR_2 bacterium RBG_13_41_10]|nr:MAG: ribose 1,5-bisphosphate isomerase [Omnitrophica WOR_2 bacterium RBG_13_41_10]